MRALTGLSVTESPVTVSRMAQTHADRQRAYRDRKRDAVTQHACPVCGRHHYPVTTSRPDTPDGDAVTPPKSDTVTGDVVTPTDCPLCAERLDAARTMATAGRRYQEEAVRLRAELAAVQARLGASESNFHAALSQLGDCETEIRTRLGDSAYQRLEARWEA